MNLTELLHFGLNPPTSARQTWFLYMVECCILVSTVLDWETHRNHMDLESIVDGKDVTVSQGYPIIRSRSQNSEPPVTCDPSAAVSCCEL